MADKETKLGAAYKNWETAHRVEIEGLLKDAFLAGFKCAIDRLDEENAEKGGER